MTRLTVPHRRVAAGALILALGGLSVLPGSAPATANPGSTEGPNPFASTNDPSYAQAATRGDKSGEGVSSRAQVPPADGPGAYSIDGP